MDLSLDRPSVQNQIYTDLSAVKNISGLQKKDAHEAHKAAAQQFESFFVNMMFKELRKGGAVFREGSLFDSDAHRTYEDMLDQQMSLELTKNSGFGLADMLVKQLDDWEERKYKPDQVIDIDPL